MLPSQPYVQSNVIDRRQTNCRQLRRRDVSFFRSFSHTQHVDSQASRLNSFLSNTPRPNSIGGLARSLLLLLLLLLRLILQSASRLRVGERGGRVSQIAPGAARLHWWGNVDDVAGAEWVTTVCLATAPGRSISKCISSWPAGSKNYLRAHASHITGGGLAKRGGNSFGIHQSKLSSGLFRTAGCMKLPPAGGRACERSS